MGILDNLSVMLGNLVSSPVFNWIRAVSIQIDSQTDGLSQATWFIDPINGNDSANGATLATALKTDGERQRRWGMNTILTQATTVTYISSPTDMVNYSVQINENASLLIQGARTVTKTGAFSAVTVRNRATQVPFDVTGGTLGASDVGKLMRINSGVRNGNYCFIEKDLGANKVRITPFGTLAINFIPWVEVTPVIGDTFEVVTVPELKIGTITFRSGTNSVYASAPLRNAVQFDSLSLNCGIPQQQTGSIFSDNISVFMSQTILTNIVLGGGVGQFFMAGGAFSGVCFLAICGFLIFMATGTVPGSTFVNVGEGCFAVFDGDCMFQNSSLFVYGRVNAGLVSYFDQATANFCLLVQEGGKYISQTYSSSNLSWGTANAGHAVVVFSGGLISYVTKPTVNGTLGAGRESQVGGTDKLWGVIPYVEPTNNAAIVLRA